MDADCDGAGSGNATKVPCDNRLAPIGYSWNNTDCDDSDPTKRRLYNRDADGDGVGAKTDTICAGGETPPGYVVEPDRSRGDCDDSNPEISYPYHLDADGDGVPAPNAPIVCGPPGQPPPNAAYTFCGDDYPGVCDDCDDTDPTIRTLYYQDLDGDGYAASTEVSVCGSPDVAPPGFGIFASELADCDDSRPDVSPEALDQWTDGVDANCDGLPPYYGYSDTCTSVETCDPAWFTIPIDLACAAADLVIISTGVWNYCGESSGEVWIGNQGTAPIAEYTLTIESSDRLTVFPIRDPLLPGARYPYRLPIVLRLSDTVRFSVTMLSPDCNPDNNTATETTTYACPV